MKGPVRKTGLALTNRVVFLFLFTLFYWVFHFIYQKMNLQLSQLVFNIAEGVFTGVVIHVAVAKALGPLLFGRSFCGWACWNAFVFEILPVRRIKKKLPEKFLGVKYFVLVALLSISWVIFLAGYHFQTKTAQFKWLLVENAVIYTVGITLTFIFGDKRAFCKYLCPAGAMMTITSPYSVLKVEKNHLKCKKCGKCDEVCPMDVPVMKYVLDNKRVNHPECIMCTECVANCPAKCLVVGTGRKSDTTPELGRSY